MLGYTSGGTLLMSVVAENGRDNMIRWSQQLHQASLPGASFVASSGALQGLDDQANLGVDHLHLQRGE